MIWFLLILLTGCTTSYHVPVQEVIEIRNTEQIYPVVVIGCGAAGTMAAKRAVLNNTPVLLFLGANQEKRRSRGNWVRTVDNIPGLERYNRVINELRDETLADISQGPFSSNLYAVNDSVVQIEKDGELFRLTDSSGNVYRGQYVLLSTGIMDEQPHIQGSIRPILPYSNGQSVAYCLVCDGHRCLDRNTVVIGHSEEAAKGAILLAEKYHPPGLALLTNGNALAISESTQEKLNRWNVKVYASPIYEVLGTNLEGFQLESGEIVKAEMGFVMLGIRPNNQLALQLGAEVDERGLVITDPKGESSVPNLFIAGDLRSGSMKQIYTAWQHAVDTIQTINSRLRSQ